MADVTGIHVEVGTTVQASPETVWDLLADVTRVPEWSPECVRTAWAGSATGTPRAGDRFTGRNRAYGREWDVTCEVTEVRRPVVFAWNVLCGPDEIAAEWRCVLDPLPDGGTRVSESFRHGPGYTGLRARVDRHPEQAADIIEGRRADLHKNIITTLAGLKTVAESGQ